MKHIFHNEVFSIRKLKVGTCSVLLAISILGSNGILADEIGTNTSQIDTKEICDVLVPMIRVIHKILIRIFLLKILIQIHLLLI